MFRKELRTTLFLSFLILAIAPHASAQKNSYVTDLEEVKQAQRALSDLGYNPGDVNGMMSSDTRQAIRQFQSVKGLPVTGNLDHETKAAIDAQERTVIGNAKPRQKPSVDQNREKSSPGGRFDKEASDRATKAAFVLQDLTSAYDRKVPDEVLRRAEAIAVIPHLVKGAFAIGGRYGRGVVSERTENGRWSTPAFIEIGGPSFGAQLGVEATDVVLIFTDRAAVNKLEEGMELKLGVDAAVTAGPTGRSIEAGVNPNLPAVYAYSRVKGLFAGVALDDAALIMDMSTNKNVYGASVDAKQILGGSMPANPTVQPFMVELDKLPLQKRISQAKRERDSAQP
jgi:lipid-binding SYLF domain-containing protein